MGGVQVIDLHYYGDFDPYLCFSFFIGWVSMFGPSSLANLSELVLHEGYK
jgi:hypothetical protein